MAKINLLSARQIAGLPVGTHSDGSNLYLRVRTPTARHWLFRYSTGGRIRQLGLGSTKERSLKDARDLADAMRKAIGRGENPADVLLPKRDPLTMTFKIYAEQLIELKLPGFRNEKHGKQWGTTLEQYAYPVIGAKRPAAITPADVETILRPLWTTKTETATRLRARVEAVLDFAYVAEGLDRRNPARYSGNLEHRGFGPPRKISPVKHQPSAPYSTVPAIMDELRALHTTTSMCLRFTILTWVRPIEARDARWSEFDADCFTWTLPPERTKPHRELKVPLCEEAREILAIVKKRKHKDSDRVFPGLRGGLLSDVGINKVLHALPSVKKLDEAATSELRARAKTDEDREATEHGATAHGFRSSAREWGAAMTDFQPFVLELALNHLNKDKVEAAYQRDTMFEKRREVMKAWGDYCRNSNVVQLVRSSNPASA